jgi:hypothetical protein
MSDGVLLYDQDDVGTNSLLLRKIASTDSIEAQPDSNI